MDGYNDDQPPFDDEHAFYVENDSGAVQISVDSHLGATHAGWLAFRRTSNGSDSGGSNMSDFTGMTASSLDESPFTDDELESFVPFDPSAPSSVNPQSQFFIHEGSSASNLTNGHRNGDDYSLISPTNPSFIPQLHSSFHGASSNVAGEQMLTVPSNFHGHGIPRRHSFSDTAAPFHYSNLHRPRRPSQSSLLAEQFTRSHVGKPQSLMAPTASEQTLAVPSDLHDHGASHLQVPPSHGRTPGMIRRHSSSDLGAHSPYPDLHRPRRPSISHVLAQQFNDLHVDGEPHLSPTALSAMSNSFPEPASPNDTIFLDVPQRRLERRYSESMGRPSQSRMYETLFQNLSESQLGMQATASSGTFAVPQETTNTAENAMGVSQYDVRFSGSALPNGAGWPVPSTGSSTPGEVTWDGETHLPVENHRMTGPFDIQTHKYPSLSQMYHVQGQHSEGLLPSRSPEDYRSPSNEFGLVGQSSHPSQPSYESSTVSSPQHLLNGDHVNNDPFSISFGERARPGYVPTFMGVDPPPQEASLAFPSNAGTGSQPVESLLQFPKRPHRRKRKHDPKAVEKMRWKNKVAQFFCDLCPTVSSFTIKGAFVRHMRETHGGLPPPACHLCVKTYSHQTSLQRHLRNEHGPNGKAAASKRKS